MASEEAGVGRSSFKQFVNLCELNSMQLFA